MQSDAQFRIRDLEVRDVHLLKKGAAKVMEFPEATVDSGNIDGC